MKKILSVILAVMVLFGAMSVTASAAYEDVRADFCLNGVLTDDQVLLVFKLNGGTTFDAVVVWENGTRVSKSGYGGDANGIYYMIPATDNSNELVVGDQIVLPKLNKKGDTLSFTGWEYTNPATNEFSVLSGGSPYTITEQVYEASNGVIVFNARYEYTEPETDTMATVMNILVKVFGAIIGILLYGGDTEAGVAMMNKVLGGLEL